MERRNALASLGALGVAWAAPLRAQTKIEAPSGRYLIDPTHASLLWRARHFGLSNYTARFTRFTAEIDFDPVDLSKCAASATIELASVETDYPAGLNMRDWNGDLRGEQFFNIVKFARATWRSTSVQVVEGNRLRIPGELSLLGVSAPITLDATLNGSYKSRPVTKLPTIGFSARGTIDRRVFGLVNPPAGDVGVGANVEIIIEAEFIKPA